MIKKILHFIWGLPQNIIGGIMWLIFSGKHRHKKYKNAYVCECPLGNVSLGMFIFVSNMNWEETVKHEYGHTIQSMILGPLYLLVIGLPSIIWAGCFDKYRQKYGVSYYSLYTEAWADKLGGVGKRRY